MDGHTQKQSSEDAPLPDDRLDERAPAATDASSTARTAHRGCQPGWRKGNNASSKGRPLVIQAGSISAECGTAGSSGGGGSIRDSAHNLTRGKDVHTGRGYFQIRGSRAHGDDVSCPDNEKGPQRTFADGSTYYGFVSGGKRDGQGTLTRTATNTKLKNGARYTGQIAGSVPNGTGTVNSAKSVDHGIFVVGAPCSEAAAMSATRSSQACNNTRNLSLVVFLMELAQRTATFSNDMDKDAAYMCKDVGKVVEKRVFVDGFLHGHGKVTFPKKGKKEGNFVNGKLDNGTTTFSSSVVLVKPLASTPVRLLAVHQMELAQ
ncbi:hypothetical protein THAOC_37846 [Thalassiosira oceanica]|uniref:Uncharacterized protein n=1 Tax=Thalassiosira oceanica TaxID=159749 RepID=K0QYE4_THAOC|nr:hypothetical protein THAOC_37846 [Thalassiosira oceanica]|eukprot:EJK43685.1 hypothetical protein THAOC_37846 [Thalassiosira oceanica]